MRSTRPLSIFVLSCTLVTVFIYLFRRQDQETFQALLDSANNALNLHHSSNETVWERCPSPYLNSSIPSALPAQTSPECVRLQLSKASAASFSASICTPKEATARCNTFDVVIKRNHCDEYPDAHLSSSTKEEQYMRRQLGADTFHVAITGTELFATAKPIEYKRCTYRYSMPLSNSGCAS